MFDRGWKVWIDFVSNNEVVDGVQKVRTDSVVGIVLTSASCDGRARWRIKRMKIRHPQHNRRTIQMPVAIYVRVSTLRQQKAQTIEHQLDRLQAHGLLPFIRDQYGIG